MWNFIDNSVANILKVYGNHTLNYKFYKKLISKFSTATYGIIGALVVTSICIYLFNNYLKLVIKSIFQYLLKPLASSRSANSIRQQNINGAGDTISSEVLNKILDITRDQTKLNALHLTRMTSNSGVQQIDVVDGNESAESDSLNVLEVESVQTSVTTTIVLTDSTDPTNDKIDS